MPDIGGCVPGGGSSESAKRHALVPPRREGSKRKGAIGKKQKKCLRMMMRMTWQKTAPVQSGPQCATFAGIIPVFGDFSIVLGVVVNWAVRGLPLARTPSVLYTSMQVVDNVLQVYLSGENGRPEPRAERPADSKRRTRLFTFTVAPQREASPGTPPSPSRQPPPWPQPSPWLWPPPPASPPRPSPPLLPWPIAGGFYGISRSVVHAPAAYLP